MKKSANLLAIDVGNSSISYGFFKSGRLRWFWHGNVDLIPKIISFIAKSGVAYGDYQVIISSVNPEKLTKIRKRLPIRPMMIGRDIQVKIRHKYNKINNLGKDRLINLYGAIHFYKCPALVISFGTALTVDFISKNRVFLGGLIIPGVETSFRALEEKASLLPKNNTLKPVKRALIGRQTKDCMILGVLQGFGSMVDGLIGRFRRKYGSDLRVIACGGNARLIKPYIQSRIHIDQMHTVKSLAYLMKRDCV